MSWKPIFFVIMNFAAVFLLLTASLDAGANRSKYFAQNLNPDVDADLEKLREPREARDLNALEKLIDSDSQKWRRLDRGSYLGYMYQACAQISSYDYRDRSKQAKLLTRYSLEVLDSVQLSLPLRLQFLEFLSYDAPDWDEGTWRHLRFQKANLWLDTWRHIATGIDPAFDTTEVPMINIDPPAGAMVPSGASPDAVKDPKLRAEYVRSLAANDAKTARIIEQQYLRMHADQFYKEAENYLVNAYSKPPPDSAELGRLLIEKGVDSSTRSSLLRKISEHN